MNMKIFYLTIISFLCLTLLNSCGKETKNTWESFVSDFVESYLKQNPDWAVYNGRHEYDGQISDYSDKGMRTRVEWFKKQKELANEFNDENLTDEKILEKKNVMRVIDENVFFMETLRKPYNNADYYAWQLAPSIYLEKNYAPLKQRMIGYVKYLKSMRVTTQQILNNFKKELPLSRYHIDIAKIVFSGFADFMKNDAPKGFETVKDEKLWNEFNDASEEVISALNKFVKWLDDQTPEATENFAMGPENFSKILYATDRLNIPLLELKKMAQDDLDRNLTALKKACQRYSPGKTSVEECIREIELKKEEYDPIEKARKQLPMLEKFLVEENVVSVPTYTKISVVETPSFMSAYFALIILPSAFDKNSEGIYYITPPDPKWSKNERIAYIMGENELLFTSAHEVWPGHFLQSLYINQSKSPLAKIFLNYTNLEGWAHYTEEMMFEKGLGNYQPEYEIAMRLDALRRNVRFLSALKMHAEGMPVKDAEQLFLKFAFLDSASARQEALRGTYDPQYYGYTLGKIFIRKLKDKWIAKTGSQKLNEFHNKFLSYGGIPISLIEESMMKIN